MFVSFCAPIRRFQVSIRLSVVMNFTLSFEARCKRPLGLKDELTGIRWPQLANSQANSDKTGRSGGVLYPRYRLHCDCAAHPHPQLPAVWPRALPIVTTKVGFVRRRPEAQGLTHFAY